MGKDILDSEKGRIKSIDIAKGIGIILVVIGHTGISSSLPGLFHWIYSFHMPLFYFLSGVCFKQEMYKNDIRQYLRYRWRNLLLPFIVFNCITFFILKLHIVEELPPAPLYYLFTGCLALYFIRVLFLSECYYLILSKISNNKIILGGGNSCDFTYLKCNN